MVRCVAGVLKARGSNEKVEFMRKQTRWITSSKEIAEVLREMADGNVTGGTSTGRESQKQRANILHHLW